ncbi:MAG: hypothetical protein U0Y10_17435 [Spirosomataceae bacterium]
MKKTSPSLDYLFLAIPIVLFFYFLSKYWVNIPQEDEYRTICQFLIRWVDAPTWQEKWSVLFTSENESKPVYYRIYFLIWYYLSGQLDFRWLMLIGNLAVLAITFHLYRQFQQLKVRPLYFLPVLLFLFQPQYWMCSLRADTSIFYLHSIFWGVYIPVLLVANTRKGYLWALGLAFLSLSTSALGLLVFVTGGLILLYQGRKNYLFGWGATLLVGYFLFLYSPHSNASAGRLLAGLFNNPLENLSLFFGYVGSFANHTSLYSRWQVVLIGLVLFWGLILLIFTLFMREPSKRHQPYFVIMTAIFLYSSAAVLLFAFTRWVGGYENTFYELVIEKNKKLFAVLFPILTYVLWMLLVNERWYRLVFGLFFTCSLIFYGFSYFSSIPEVAFNKRELLLDSFHWRHGNTLISMPVRKANPILNQVYGWFFSKQKYQFPASYLAELEDELLKQPDSAAIQKMPDLKVFTYQKNKTDMYQINRTFYRFANERYQNPEKSLYDGAYLVLKSATDTYVIPTQNNRNGKGNFLMTGRWFREGFATDVEAVFPKNIYRFGLLTVENDHLTLIYTDKLLHVN